MRAVTGQLPRAFRCEKNPVRTPDDSIYRAFFKGQNCRKRQCVSGPRGKDRAEAGKRHVYRGNMRVPAAAAMLSAPTLRRGPPDSDTQLLPLGENV